MSGESCLNPKKPFSNAQVLQGFLIFQILLVIQYFLYRKVNEKQVHPKYAPEQVNDIELLLIHTSMMYAFGNMWNLGYVYDPIWLIMFFITPYVYNWIGNQPGLSASLVSVWSNRRAMTVFGIFALFIFIAFIVQILEAKKRKILPFYLGALVYIVIMMGLGIAFAKDGPEADRTNFLFHPHHISWSFLLTFFFRFDNVTSKIMHGMLTGVLLQGYAHYGYASNFHYTITRPFKNKK